jgi:hypothetical protein
MTASTAPVTVGVDTHLDTHVAAVLDHTPGGCVAPRSSRPRPAAMSPCHLGRTLRAGGAQHPSVDGDVVDLDPAFVSNSSTSRYDSAKRRYQRTASTMTSGGKQKPAKADGARGAGPGRRVVMATVCVTWLAQSRCNSAPCGPCAPRGACRPTRCCPGQIPAQLAKCPAEGNWPMSVPISASNTISSARADINAHEDS